MTALLLAALLALNVSSALIFWADKRAAGGGRRRVPERVLLLLAALGAAPALVWATHRFRHKTRKEPFRTLLLVILAIQISTVAVLLVLL